MVTNVDGSVLNTVIIAEPDELREQSEKVRQNANVMRTIWQEITHLVNTTNTYWNGEAAEHFRNAFNNYTDVIESMASKVENQAVRLERIAGVYDEAAIQTEQIIEALPTDILK